MVVEKEFDWVESKDIEKAEYLDIEKAAALADKMVEKKELSKVE